MLDVDHTQDPIPGTVFSPIAFSEPEPILVNEDATPFTTGPTNVMSTSSELDSTNVNTDQPMVNIVNMPNLTSSNDPKFNNTSVTTPLTTSQPQSIQENVTTGTVADLSGKVVTTDKKTITSSTVTVHSTDPVLLPGKCVVKLEQLNPQVL